MIINLQQEVCYRLENPFLAIIPENHWEDMAYVFRTIDFFTADGLSAHAPVPALCQ
jgi:hypothetical protein